MCYEAVPDLDLVPFARVISLNIVHKSGPCKKIVWFQMRLRITKRKDVENLWKEKQKSPEIIVYEACSKFIFKKQAIS